MNPRPSGYEPDELPNCSTPRRIVTMPSPCGQTIRGQAGIAGCDVLLLDVRIRSVVPLLP